MKYNVIALMGKAGSGKDSILHNIFLEDEAHQYHDYLHEIISCTTRPKRENEIDGVNYHFLTEIEYFELDCAHELIETSEFREWHYGTPYSSLDPNKINIGVYNPTGVRSLLNNPNLNVVVFYVQCPDKERVLRQLNREENPDVDEIIRRYSTDKADFADLSDIPYTVIDNLRQGADEDWGKMIQIFAYSHFMAKDN